MTSHARSSGDMPVASPGDTSRWAVLVGIDNYNGKGDLKGCVNDAVLVCDYLQQYLLVPANQIFLHLAPRATECLETDGKALGVRRLEATPEAVKRSLEEVKRASEKARNAGHGAFIHFHFSGHGDRKDTIFREGADFASKRSKLLWFPSLELATSALPKKEQHKFEVTQKSQGAKDELLCFPHDKDIRDAEFGKMLAEIVAAGLTASVTIDCCFAGGTMRDGDKAIIRSKPHAFISSKRACQTRDETSTPSVYRNSIQRDSFLYREQEQYNAIMACQADQYASERSIMQNGDEKFYGAFTFTLIDILHDFASHRREMTYQQFQGILGVVPSGQQIPAFFGPDNRILFDCRTGLNSHELGYVKKDGDNKTLVIAKGTLMGARVKDKYRLLEKASAETEGTDHDSLVEIVSVDHFESKLRFLHSPPQPLDEVVRTKRVAQLVKRAPINVLLTHDKSEFTTEVVGRIRREWTDETDTSFCLLAQCMEGEPQGNAELHVHFGQKELDIRDNKGELFNRLPKVSIAGLNASRLIFILESIQKFQNFSHMRTPETLKGEKPFKFELIPVDLPENIDRGSDLVVASHCIKFSNMSTTRLFFTVFNLNPRYGIEKVFPPTNNGQHVGAKDIIGGNPDELEMITDTTVPRELKEQDGPDCVVHDTRRVIVTTHPVDLRCFEQPDITSEGGQGGVQRPAHQRSEIKMPATGWWIEDFEIAPNESKGTEPCSRPKIKKPCVQQIPNRGFGVLEGHTLHDLTSGPDKCLFTVRRTMYSNCRRSRRGATGSGALASGADAWRFTTLRARMILHKQDRLSELEAQLHKIDRDEAKPIYRCSKRRDANLARKALLEQLDTAMTEYDDLIQRTQHALATRAVASRDVENVGQWVESIGSISRPDTAYLAHKRDLMALGPAETDELLVSVAHRVEDALIGLSERFGWDNRNDYTDDQDVHIFSDRLIKTISRSVLAVFASSFLLVPIIVLTLVEAPAARLAVVLLSDGIFVFVVSVLAVARIGEMMMAGAAYAAVMIVYIAGIN
ncbi:hypothetical protein O1611_g28 [Lasiodiplodia mahajangana]|uniref:Uncharacterized protein n=1 Tax=Lasiodiplodia mahajangana TaxID=1108764 RepID=A0ACC2K1Y3_9PEZI|nr:hypothetical protein O1611_g28 [Lasiodiplodia mahajangana]